MSVSSLLCFGSLAHVSVGQEKDSREKILADQKRLAEQYELLEQKLFSLYKFEQDQNPDRSELLQKAFQYSRERLTLQKFKAAVRQLEESRFRNAGKNQGQIAAELQQLLALLQSEDRSQRVREQIQQYREYLKEINRVLRIQQGLRGQAEDGDANDEQSEQQSNNADRIEKLEQKISNEQGAAQSSGNQESAEPKSDQASRTPGDGNAPNQQGQPQENQPQDNSADQVQDKLQRAEQAMRDAAEKIKQAQQQQSVKKMREAEAELEQAKQELERILRQLREEEIQRLLTTLEDRFRKMLEAETRVHDDTISLHASVDSASRDEFEVQAGRLSVRQKSIVTQADQALLVLEDEGSSVAITETLIQVRDDMQQVTTRLNLARTGESTQEIQQSIIQSLGFLVEVFEQAREAQEQRQSENQQSSNNQGQAGEQALVNQLAELKLLRSLQEQILNRHQRYARLLANPDDPTGHSSDPDVQRSLNKLQKRQARLYEITNDIALEMNQ